MAFQAYDANGHKINYAIFDGDYVVRDDRNIAVTIAICKVSPENATLNVIDEDGKMLAGDVSVDRVFNGRGFEVTAVIHPIDVPRIDAGPGLVRYIEMIDRLRQERRDLAKLPFDDADMAKAKWKIEVVEMINHVYVRAVFGMTAHQLISRY